MFFNEDIEDVLPPQTIQLASCRSEKGYLFGSKVCMYTKHCKFHRESYQLLLSDNSAKSISMAYHSVLSLMAVSLIVVFSFQFCDFVFDVNKLNLKCVVHCAITKTDYCKPNVYCRRPGPCHLLN